MKISLILPVYQVSAYIAECLQSILEQTNDDFELIVVDDCGTDDSMTVAHSLLDSGRQCRPTGCNVIDVQWLKHEHNRGLSAARNMGLKAARGEYVFFADSDDRLMPQCLTLLLQAADAERADMAVGDFLVDGDASWTPRLHTDESLIADSTEALHAYLRGDYYMMAWNKLLRRDFLIAHHLLFEEGLLHEDNPWSFAVACHAKRVAIVHAETYIYRVRGNSLQTGSDFTPHYEAYRTILKLIAQKAVEMHLTRDAVFRSYFERIKALYFRMTEERGTMSEQRRLYALIRHLLPSPKSTKMYIHYNLPSMVGYCLYKRFCKHLLC